MIKVINKFCNFCYLFYLTFGEEYKSVILVIQENYNNLPRKNPKKITPQNYLAKKRGLVIIGLLRNQKPEPKLLGTR